MSPLSRFPSAAHCHASAATWPDLTLCSLLCSLDYPPLFSTHELLCFIVRKRKTTLFQRDLHKPPSVLLHTRRPLSPSASLAPLPAAYSLF
ncbi:hypothetical protein A2U01_0034971 [Trifolium medium]|uniref:Uncharacterized protein n=1 Tax=Trifolium medium TaxID=97028 RepID=A0A392PQS9_9FABA|nr:hypothetical protein [Trifolium medium]